VQVYRKRTGVLGPIYRLVGRGLNDQDIAKELNIPKSTVHDCISAMLKSFDMPDRLDLVRHASATSRRDPPNQPKSSPDS
jgi:orotate phosphoribosyltransferase-like protein